VTVKNRLNEFFIVTILFLFTRTLYPADPNLFCNYLSTRDGLSHNSVVSMVQDDPGYFWFATDDGLNRYDGYNFIQFHHDPDDPESLGSSRISKVIKDKNGDIWVGTNWGGINKYVRSTGKFERYLVNPEKPDADVNNIFALYEDSKGELWVGSYSGDLFTFDRQEKKFNQIFAFPPNGQNSMKNINSIFEDHQGNIWVGTVSGLYRSVDSEHFELYPIDSGASTGNLKVYSLFEDSKKNLWVGTDDGVYTKESQAALLKLSEGLIAEKMNGIRIYSFMEDPSGRIWIGTWDGIYLYEESTGKITSFEKKFKDTFRLNSSMITSLFLDKEGIIWVGTLNGINFFNLNKKHFAYYNVQQLTENKVKHPLVLTLYEDSESVFWISSYNNGLVKFTRSDRSFTIFNTENSGLPSNIILCITEDESNNLWLGTMDGGLIKFNKKTEKFTVYKNSENDSASISSNSVSCIHIIDEDKYLVATSKGLNEFDPSSGKFRSYINDPKDPDSLSYNWITSIFRDSRGNFWISTYGGGLNKFDLDTGKFKRFVHRETDPDSIPTNRIYGMVEDPAGILWMGSMKGGLIRFSPKTGKFRAFLENDGLTDDIVWDILMDNQDDLWLSTNKGLFKFEINEERFKNYRDEEIQNMNFFQQENAARMRNGDMVFCGDGGFISIVPEGITKNMYVPPVVITSVKINRNGVTRDIRDFMERGVEFSYRDDLVTIEFAALSYSSSRKNQYAYLIEGLNENWVSLNNIHSVSFSRLEEGEFVFRVKGSNNDGVWNESGVSFTLSSIPAFWNTWLFRIFVCILSCLIFLVFHRIRMRRLTIKLNHEARRDLFFFKYKLSEREAEIARLILKGMKNQEIEDKLFISMGTVKNHIYNIFQKTGVNDRGSFIIKVRDHVYRSRPPESSEPLPEKPE